MISSTYDCFNFCHITRHTQSKDSFLKPFTCTSLKKIPLEFLEFFFQSSEKKIGTCTAGEFSKPRTTFSLPEDKKFAFLNDKDLVFSVARKLVGFNCVAARVTGN